MSTAPVIPGVEQEPQPGMAAFANAPANRGVEAEFDRSWRALQWEVNQLAAMPDLEEGDQATLVAIFQAANPVRKSYQEDEAPASLIHLCDTTISALIHANRRLIDICVVKYLRVAEPEDIRSEAVTSLFEAASSYDPALSDSFKSYAGTIVRNRLIDRFRDNEVGHAALRVPRSARQVSGKLGSLGLEFSSLRIVKEKPEPQIEAEDKLPATEVKNWTDQQISDKLGIKLDLWQSFVRRSGLLENLSTDYNPMNNTDDVGPGLGSDATWFWDRSLDAISQSQLIHLVRRVIDDNTYSGWVSRSEGGRFYAGHWVDDRKVLRGMRISPKAREATYRYYGWLGETPKLMGVIASELGVSEARVSQLRSEVTKKTGRILLSIPGADDFFTQLLA